MLNSFVRSVVFLRPNLRYLSLEGRQVKALAMDTAVHWREVAKNFDAKQVEFYHSEKLITVDENDCVVGCMSKGESHAIETVKKSIYHRALSLLVFDDNDRFLLTQRAACKITFPNYFTNACCSHPLYINQELEDDGDAIGVKRAVIRRSNFELGTGLDDITLPELKLVNRIAYRAESDGGIWGEAEVDYIFILKKNITLAVNPEEVQSHRYVTKDEMKDLLLNHHKYGIKITPWMKLLARDFLFKYWDNLEKLEEIAKPESIVHYRDLFPAV